MMNMSYKYGYHYIWVNAKVYLPLKMPALWWWDVGKIPKSNIYATSGNWNIGQLEQIDRGNCIVEQFDWFGEISLNRFKLFVFLSTKCFGNDNLCCLILHFPISSSAVG